MDSKIYDEIYTIYKEGNINWKSVADEFGFSSKDSVRSQFKRERKKRGDAPISHVESIEEVDEKERTTYTESDDSIHVVCDSKRIKTRQDVIEFFNVDTKIWKIKEFTVRTSEGYRKDRKVDWHVKDGVVESGDVEDSGKILLVPMMHTETKFVRKEANDISFEDVDEFFDKYKNVSLSQHSIPRQYTQGGLILEVDLMDTHVGNESLTFEELRFRVEDLVESIKRKTIGLSLEKIILIQGGDIFHFDTYTRTTTGGTLVTYGSDTFTMFDNGILLMTWIINELSKITKIEVINLYGNHDKASSYLLGKTLEAGFKNDDNVEIDTKHEMRKFRKIGSTSVGFVHGDMPKNNIYGTLQREARKLFGETLYSECHMGHLHHDWSNEKDGVIYRWLPSITIPDQWHIDNGYTNAKQGTQCFLWDTKNDGYVDIWMIPVHSQRE